MRLIVTDSYEKMGMEAANIVAGQVYLKPNSVLGLATGSTPVSMYQRLVAVHQSVGLDFSEVTTFNLDEYIGMSPDNPQSYHYFMQENFFRHINIIKPEDKFYFQDGMISWVHTSEAEINPVYVSYLFDSQSIRQQIDRVVSGTTVAYLSIAQLSNFDILLPAIELQNQFADFVAITDKSKNAAQSQISKLKQEKEAAIQKYFKS